MLIRKFILRIIYLLCGLRTVVTRDLPGSRDNVIIGAKTSENKPDERGGNNCIDCGPHSIGDEIKHEEIQRHTVRPQRPTPLKGVVKPFIRLHNVNVKVHSRTDQHLSDAAAAKGIALENEATSLNGLHSDIVDSTVYKKPTIDDSRSETGKSLYQNTMPGYENVFTPDPKLKDHKPEEKEKGDEAFGQDGSITYQHDSLADQAPSIKEKGHTNIPSANIRATRKGGSRQADEETFESQIEKEMNFKIHKTHNTSEIIKFFNMYEEYINQKSGTEKSESDTKLAGKLISPKANERHMDNITESHIKGITPGVNTHTNISGNEHTQENTEKDIIVKRVYIEKAKQLNTQHVQKNLMQTEINNTTDSISVNSKIHANNGNTIISKSFKTDADSGEIKLVNKITSEVKPGPKLMHVTSKSQTSHVENIGWMDYDVDPPSTESEVRELPKPINKDVEQIATVQVSETFKDAAVHDKQKQEEKNAKHEASILDIKTVNYKQNQLDKDMKNKATTQDVKMDNDKQKTLDTNVKDKAPTQSIKTVNDKQKPFNKDVEKKAKTQNIKAVNAVEVHDKHKLSEEDVMQNATVQDGRVVKKADDVDVIIPVGQLDRWSMEGLDQVPDAARLEQKLHPMVDAPVRDIIDALRNMLRRVQHQLARVQNDFSNINNITRWRYMTGVRAHLTTLAEQNDHIYSVMLESALLTKQIYRRAHERRHPLNYRYDATPVADMRYKSRKFENAAHEELKQAEDKRSHVKGSIEKWKVVNSEYIRMSQTLADWHPMKAIHDLERHANHTMRTVMNAQRLLDTRPRRLSVRDSSVLGEADLRHLVTKATTFNADTKSILMVSMSLIHEIRDLRRHRSTSHVADMTFDESRMMKWVLVDKAGMHADELLKEATMIRMQLSPLIRRAAAILASKASSGSERQIQAISNTLHRDVKELTRILDKIRVIIGDRTFRKARCEHVEGSGAGMGDDVDDDVTMTDCNEHIEESSGGGVETDLPEGSGEVDALTVDLGQPGISGLPEVVTSANIADLILDPDEILLIDDDTAANSDTLSTSAPSTATTTQPEVNDNNPSSTAKQDSTRTARSADVRGFINLGISDPFGNFSPYPAGGAAVKSLDGNHDANQEAINAAIRKRLSGYVHTSRGLFNQSRDLKTILQDLSNAWSNVSSKFSALENFTMVAKSAVAEYRVKANYVRTSNARIADITNRIDLQASVIDSQCKNAVQTAERKLTEFQKYSAENQDTSGQAPDPVAVQQAVNAVKQASTNANEIQRLTELHPDPCGAVDRHDRHIRGNITRLREQIEHARTIAATMQLSVALTKDRQLRLPIPEYAVQDTPLSSNLLVMVRPSDVTGHLMTINYNETGSVSVHLKDRLPVLKQTFDGNDVTEDGRSPLETDVWYKIMLERFATSHKLTVKGTSGQESSVSVNSTKLFDDLDWSRATSVLLGDTKRSMGCAGGLTVNSRILALEGAVAGSCSNSVAFQPEDMSLILDGTGFARYNLDRQRSIRDLELQFTSYSDGEVTSFQTKYMTTKLHVRVSGGKLHVLLSHNNIETRLVSKQLVFGEPLTLKVNTANRRGGSVIINGNPDLLEVSTEPEAVDRVPEMDGLVLGSTMNNRSSIIGCFGGLSVNEQAVGLQMVKDALATGFGQCQERSCVSFTEQSTPVSLGEVGTGLRAARCGGGRSTGAGPELRQER
ncbi:uncharacterized protein LOC127841209 [Dreissena polymorpha]